MMYFDIKPMLLLADFNNNEFEQIRIHHRYRLLDMPGHPFHCGLFTILFVRVIEPRELLWRMRFYILLQSIVYRCNPNAKCFILPDNFIDRINKCVHFKSATYSDRPGNGRDTRAGIHDIHVPDPLLWLR
ncbi:hypothetical protein D3C78_971230 [compost metagenome]